MRNKCQRNRFVVSQRQRPRPQSAVHGRVRQLHHRAAVSRQDIIELVVSMQPGDFLDDVNLTLDIQPPARNLYPELRLILPFRNQSEPQLLENAENFSRSKTPAKNAT